MDGSYNVFDHDRDSPASSQPAPDDYSPYPFVSPGCGFKFSSVTFHRVTNLFFKNRSELWISTWNLPSSDRLSGR